MQRGPAAGPRLQESVGRTMIEVHRRQPILVGACLARLAKIVVAQAERIIATATMPPRGWAAPQSRRATSADNFLHEVSDALVKTHDRLVIENLNVTGMLANHRQARAISDAGWAEFARLAGLQTGLAWRLLVEVADRWYPSSKLCSACGGTQLGI